MSYTILINDDNTMMATQKQRIIQHSKLVDTFRFLVPITYNGINMADCTVLLEYLKPVSKEYKTEILTKSDELYKEHLQYMLPVDTEFTREAGKLELQLTFLKADMSTEGVVTQIVRKTAPVHTIDIIPISAWSDVIPDSALTSLDQRLMKIDAQLRAMEDAESATDKIHVDGLAFNSLTNELQLTAAGIKIGNTVVLNSSDAEEDDGDDTPIIPPTGGDDNNDPDQGGTDDEEDKEETDNVIEF